MKKKNNPKKQNTAVFLALFFAVIAAVVGGMIYFQISRAPKTVPTTTAAAVSQTQAAATGESTTAEAPQTDKAQQAGIDAATYYAENAEKVIAVTPAETSEEVYSEQAVGEAMTARGFGENYPVSYMYGMDGSVSEKTPADTSSNETHPQYTVMYYAKSGEYWTITVCNDCVTAYPVTYNLEHNSGTEVILAESESITAYDSETNSFYDMIPKNSVLALKRIPAITAQALDTLTAEEIDKL